MALDKNRLGSAIATAVKAISIPQSSPITDAKMIEIWQAVSDEIIKEFTTNGVVNTIVITPDTINGTGVGGIS
jgi:hypothetical protein